ncbi:MAG: hypothetical protein IJZ83_03445 [Clostridia bacterium]|nr:hypothetical protein [Clostridia bacterium]
MSKNSAKEQILASALEAQRKNYDAVSRLTDSVVLTEYRKLTIEGIHGTIWTKALQTALDEHEIVIIPASQHIYWLDGTIIVPSNRRIEASGATIRLVPEFPYIMMCNKHIHDGTRAPIDTSDRDMNISIHGGNWEESCTVRGKRRLNAEHGKNFKGVQTCMLFNNLDHLTITDVTFAHATSFCVQIGDLTDGVFENFNFISCYADGLHVNGNCENLYVKNFRGHVGDDLVALNMYDWIGSSINYGPANNIYCENIISAPDSKAKMMRLQPGIFKFENGTLIDCSLTNVYVKHARGIFEYKLYFQSPRYRLGEKPEGEGAGSADNIFFEDIEIIAQRPWYPDESDEKRGHFGMFFSNSNVGYLSLKNIQYTTTPSISSKTHLIAIGPMSCHRDDKEVFDPYVSATLDILELEDIFVNGKRATEITDLIKIIEFDNVNEDGFSSGKGKVNHIILDGKTIL